VIRIALAPADAVLVHSQADGQILEQILPGVPYRVSPLPTYAGLGEQTAASLPCSLPEDRPLLLFAGFVRPYKGLDLLLEALPEVLAVQPVHLLVAGEFWQDSALYREQIARLGIEDAVTIIDEYLPDELLAACLEEADVLVLPYRHATQSAVIQLAFGKGRPVITTDVGGLSEVVEDGKTGLVVPPENPQVLAAAINRFFAAGLGPAFKENIRRAHARFSWAGLVSALLNLDQEQRRAGNS
jgi:glycosyltransferase involved in cell wall biosynthesis